MQTKALLLLVLSITLAACGSSNNKSNLTDSNISGSTGNTGGNAGGNTGGNTDSNNSGNTAKNKGLLLTVDSSSPLKLTSNKLTSNTRTSISVDGHTISLVPADKYTENFPQTYSSFGKVELSQTPYLYSIGEITSDMPTSGIATYKGKTFEAIHLSTDKDKVYEYQGYFTAEVDFANKSIDGDFRISAMHINPFKAKIDGSSFTGTVSNSDYDIGNVEGRFYGPQASEIGGVYYKHNAPKTIWGSFGGTRGDIRE